MRYRIFDDPFKDKQPKQNFVKELTLPVHECKPFGFNERKADTNELFLGAVKLNFNFPDRVFGRLITGSFSPDALAFFIKK